MKSSFQSKIEIGVALNEAIRVVKNLAVELDEAVVSFAHEPESQLLVPIEHELGRLLEILRRFRLRAEKRDITAS